MRAPDFTLLTIPHSGTRFLMGYFVSYLKFHHINLSIDQSMVTFRQVHVDRVKPHFIKDLETKKVVCSVRHPHSSWISTKTRGHISFDDYIRSWRSFLNWLPRLDHLIINLECSTEQRLPQFITLAKFVGATNYSKQTEKYVRRWKLRGSQSSAHKELYKHDKTLPVGYDYKRLDFAVNWYQNLKTLTDK